MFQMPFSLFLIIYRQKINIIIFIFSCSSTNCRYFPFPINLRWESWKSVGGLFLDSCSIDIFDKNIVVPHDLDYQVFIISLKIRLQEYFSYFSSFAFPFNFRISQFLNGLLEFCLRLHWLCSLISGEWTY